MHHVVQAFHHKQHRSLLRRGRRGVETNGMKVAGCSLKPKPVARYIQIIRTSLEAGPADTNVWLPSNTISRGLIRNQSLE